MIDEKEVLKILKRYEGRMNPTAYFSLEADIVNIEALDQDPTTKNDLGVDCISREQALKELKESAEHHANDSREKVLLRRDRDIIRALPSVTPQEPILDKIFCIIHPLSIMSTPELEHKAIMQIAEMLEPLCLPESEDKE